MIRFIANGRPGYCAVVPQSLLASSSALALMCLSAPASAQSTATTTTSADATADSTVAPVATPAQSPAGVQDIIVTAERRSARLQSVPISITAVTGPALVAAGVRSTADLAQVTPGLVLPTGISGGPVLQPFIRGIGSTSTLPGIEASVATYVDGVYSSDKFLNVIDLANIERVEVLKGPQGTLYGRNATGGAINIITQKPSEILGGTASLSYGRFGEVVEKGYLTGPVTSTLAASVSVVARQGGDFSRNLFSGREFGGVHSWTVNGQVAWTPIERLHVDLSGTFARRRDSFSANTGAQIPGAPPVGAAFGGQYSTDPRHPYVDVETRLNGRGYLGSGRVRYSLDNIDLLSVTAYKRGTFKSTLDADNTSFPLESIAYKVKSHSFSQEIQALSTSDSRFQWIVGGYYFRAREGYDPFTVVLSRALSPTDLSYFSFVRTEAESVFGQGTYELFPGTKLTAGLRYNTEKKSLDASLVSPTFGNIVIGGPISPSDRFRKLTWRFSVDHKLAKDVLVYASYNRGFKSGSFNVLDLTPGVQGVKPEVLDAYEVGVKSQFADRKIQLNLAGYYYDYKNIQLQRVATGGGTSQAVLENAASATLYGLDGDIVVIPIRGLQLSGGFNLEHSNYDSYVGASGVNTGPGTQIDVVLDYTGKQLLVAPNLTFNVGGSYKFDIGPGSILLSANYSHSSFYRFSPGNGQFTRAFGLLNGSIGFTDSKERYTVEFWGRNLTNEQKIGEYASAVDIGYVQHQPLSYGFTVSTKF
ncbi:TonB-dependent receptor [Sphingomonas sp.]|uniref:TonB-dependent receptor n=1 Tax=Sphingomonas sp. TaxID=28214 RepID=UPI003AFF8394